MNAVKKERPCDLVNIPVQRWMHVAVVMINKTIDIYLNGKLTRSCTLENVPKMNKGYVHICQNGGFSGKLCDLFYFNQAYSPGKIYSIYNSGPNSFDAYRYLDKFITANKLSFIQGNVIKYICRYDKKNGNEDIDKAIHYCELLKELK